ncbi:glycosyltransferase family 2 protein [Paenibacillus pabuli]|uniref:glycosyltransferase family 2 protein n=2 Tax=Paenibacillus pabuli TaxID=1472 RepID=UPI000A7B4D0C|nr:glycosyltransferase family A protein [Paenibacillus pabuli]
MKGRSRGVRRHRTVRRRTTRNRTIGRRALTKSPVKSSAANKHVARSLVMHESWKAGITAGSKMLENNESIEQHARGAWQEHEAKISAELRSYSAAMQAGKAFMQGYAHASGRSLNIVPLALHKSAAAVICACNEELTLGKVLAQLKRLPLKDIVVVLNGTTDNSLTQVLEQPGVTLVYEPDRAGHDVGRALGAKLTEADTLLFVDGDMVVPAEQLAPFLYAVDRGDDVALNNLSSLLPPFARQDEVSRIKAYLNRVLNRSDLGSNSLTAVPHALSRNMIQIVKPEALAVPPKAQSLAIQHGLKVTAPSQVDVIRSNRLRSTNMGSGNEVARLIIGDHLEALAAWLEMGGSPPQAHLLSRAEVAYRRNAR